MMITFTSMVFISFEEPLMSQPIPRVVAPLYASGSSDTSIWPFTVSTSLPVGDFDFPVNTPNYPRASDSRNNPP